MADLRMKKQTSRFGSFSTVDIDDYYGFVYRASTSHATELSFATIASENSLPFNYTDFIKFWDEGATHPVSGTQSENNPLFEGYIEIQEPGGHANEVRIVAYDPTFRAGKMLVAMSEPWELASSSSGFPVPGDGAGPRVVYNVTVENDDDWAYAIHLDATLGQIIATVLDDAYLPLVHLNAAPGDGTPAGNQQAWDSDDLGTESGGSSSSESSGEWYGGIDFKPQGKFVAQSESIRSFIERILNQWAPKYRMFWRPGTRKWRFFDTTDATARTVTVNKPEDTYGTVLAMDVRRSVDRRYSAVEFYGPESIEWATAHWKDASVADSSWSDTLSLTYDGSVDVNSTSEAQCIASLTITDPDFTRIAREGPTEIQVPDDTIVWARENGAVVDVLGQSLVTTKSWALLVKYASSAGGDGLWHTFRGYRVDTRNGIIDLAGSCLYRYNASPLSSGGDEVELPLEIKFIYPRFADPITVRYPSTGFSGTVSSVAGIENVWRQYDEDLSVGRVYGTPVTTATREARFYELAQQVHDKVSDIAYSGGLVLDGIAYDFAFLDRRVNIAAVDGDGASLTTGWESIGASVTDVEIDFENLSTSLTLNADQMELVGINPELLKDRLQILDATPVFYFSFNFVSTLGTVRNAQNRGQTTQLIDFSVNQGVVFLDEFGNRQ